MLYLKRCFDNSSSFCYSYDGGVIVQKSITLGEPVIYVSMNYRYVLSMQSCPTDLLNVGKQNTGSQVRVDTNDYLLNKSLNTPFLFQAFGFLSSQEVKDAGIGNLGLQDRTSLCCWWSMRLKYDKYLNFRTRSFTMGTEIYRSIWR